MLTAPPTGAREFDHTPAFNVFIAYDDFASGTHAKQTYDFVVDQLGAECRCTNQMWKFSVLSIPKLAEIAAQDARAADIIMISCSGDALPESVKTWIEAWLPHAHNALALVALFEPSHPNPIHSWATRTYLAEVARRGGWAFFAQPELWPEGNSGNGIILTGAEQHASSLAALLSATEPDTSFPRWGINE